MTQAGGFEPPPYPYDRLDALQSAAAVHDGGVVDLSVGTPGDPPAPAVVEALGRSGVERALGLLRAEVERGMKLMGCRSIGELSRNQLRFR